MSKITIEIEDKSIDKVIDNLNKSIDTYLDKVLKLPSNLSRKEKIQSILGDSDSSKFEAISQTLWIINILELAKSQGTYIYPF